jgi:hypothetical protein
MILELKGEQYELNRENTVIFTGETLLNGIYLDRDDDYLFLPNDGEVIPCYQELEDALAGEGVTVYELDSYDPIAQPFCFIINALCRVFRSELDVVLGSNNEA